MFPKIFQGVSVVDFSRLLPGPFATRLLHQLGAEVHCLVPPQGDAVLGDYTPFETLREGKAIHAVDLKTEAGRAEALEWIAKSPILIEGFRPGTMDRLGLSFEACRRVRPDLLYVSLIGYPAQDPKYLRGGHDLNFLVESGIYSLLYGDAGTDIPALQVADVLGGLYAAFRILAAWIQRSQTPGAQRIEVSVVESLEHLWEYLRHESSSGLLSLLTGSLARYRIYFTKDRQRVVVAGLEPKFLRATLEALQLECREGEGEEELAARMQAAFAQRDLQYWRERFRGVDACVSFIPSRAEVLARRD
ncbi:MAG: CaiB/BaiF CoA-transferase family protein [bacterium]